MIVLIEPPEMVIKMAEIQAQGSPCHKSKRGAVAFFPSPVKHGEVTITGIGYNGPPPSYQCDGSAACRESCGKRCIHAEIRALRLLQMMSPKLLSGMHLVHVKIGALGRLVAGGPPSCVDCSKEILDIGIGTVWLYEADGDIKLDERGDVARAEPDTLSSMLEQRGTWRSYDSGRFHELSRRNAKGAQRLIAGEVY